MNAWPTRLADYFAAGGRQALADYLTRQRWFGAKGRQIADVRLLDHAAVSGTVRPTVLAVVSVEFSQGPAQRYFLPLVVTPQAETGEASTPDIVGILPDPLEQTVLVIDATADATACLKLVEGIRDGHQWQAARGRFCSTSTIAAGPTLSEPLQDVKRLSGEQSNTSIVFDRRVILKLIRKFDSGINPDREILDFLTRIHYRAVPPLIGTIEYQDSFETQGIPQASATVGLLQTFIPNDGDGWSAMLEHVKTLLHDSRVHNIGQRTDAGVREFVQQASLGDITAMQRLGSITAELHTALSSDATDPAFRPERISPDDVSDWRDGMRSHIRAVFVQLKGLERRRQAELGLTDDEVASLEAGAERQLKVLERLVDDPVTKIRVHGDYHLGQVLKTGPDFIVLDFEGEPARKLEARRAKQCALKDVAGMLRSFNYAARAAQRQAVEKGHVDERILAVWERIIANAFWTGYATTATPGQVSFMPNTQAGAEQVLRVFEVDKTVYEIGYELNNRPDWVDIPLQGLRRLLEPPTR